jgi:hypothetical protein
MAVGKGSNLRLAVAVAFCTATEKLQEASRHAVTAVRMNKEICLCLRLIVPTLQLSQLAPRKMMSLSQPAAATEE